MRYTAHSHLFLLYILQDILRLHNCGDVYKRQLAKRATAVRSLSVQQIVDFNPRPRKEGDLMTTETTRIRVQFQSTPSQRGRQKSSHTSLCDGGFQSTPCLLYTSTASAVASECLTLISIHALVKRATTYADTVAYQLYISIHALVKRATVRYKPCT